MNTALSKTLLPLGILGAATVGLLLLTGAGSGSRVPADVAENIKKAGQRISELFEAPGLGRVVEALLYTRIAGEGILPSYRKMGLTYMLMTAKDVVVDLRDEYRAMVQANEQAFGQIGSPIPWRALLRNAFDNGAARISLHWFKGSNVDEILARANVEPTSPADLSNVPDGFLTFIVE
jgi:hypothetical protein